MSKAKEFDAVHAAAHGYTLDDWNDVSDNPEWTDDDCAKAKPFAEVLPDLAANTGRARGRPRVEKPRQQISIRLDPDVISKFKATGPGWQTRINEVLRQVKI